MIKEEEIISRMNQDKKEMRELLRKSMAEEDQFMKNTYLNIRSKIYERVITLEWVLGIRKSIDD